MATKEDILEQIVEEYLIHQGYFVQHNIKFRPSEEHEDYNIQQDSVHSDIDVLAIHPKKKGFKRVMAVSCKSWQAGFSPQAKINAFNNNNEREMRGFRELFYAKWSEAFVDKIKELTDEKEFTHVVAVSRLQGARNLSDDEKKEIWEGYFAEYRPKKFSDNPCTIRTFEEMVTDVMKNLTRTLAPSEVGRLLQMFKAAKIPKIEDWVKRIGS